MQAIIKYLLVLLVFPSFGQMLYTADIKDDNGREIPYVHVWVENTTNGTITNEKGKFELRKENFPVKIHISHLSYESKVLNIKSKKDLPKTIRLKSLYYELPTAVVSTEKLIDLTQDYWYDLSDFEVYQDHLLLLTYQWKRKQNPWLVMLNAYGDTLWSEAVNRDGELYKDCLGNIHLVTKKAAYQIFIEEETCQFYPAVSISDFKAQLGPCIESHDDKIYIKQYAYNNQVLNYFEGDLKDTSYRQIGQIVDRRAIRQMSDDMSGPSKNEHEKRFDQLFFYDPIYAPLIRRGDSTIIFDFVNGEINILGQNLNEIHTAKIEFHKTLKWKEKLFIDESNDKIYTMFRRGGFHSLHEINLNDASLSEAINIPEFTFIGKLRVHQDKIYFLYRDRQEDQALTKIYMMRVD